MSATCRIPFSTGTKDLAESYLAGLLGACCLSKAPQCDHLLGEYILALWAILIHLLFLLVAHLLVFRASADTILVCVCSADMSCRFGTQLGCLAYRLRGFLLDHSFGTGPFFAMIFDQNLQ